MALRRSQDTIWLGSFVAAGLCCAALVAACGGDDDDNGGGGAGAATSSTTTTTFTVTTSSSTGQGGAGGTEIDQQACDDAWEKLTVECAQGTGGAGTGGAGTGGVGGVGGEPGAGGAPEQPACTAIQTCKSLCILDATCTEIQTAGLRYLDCLGCCDEYTPGCG